MGRKEVSQVEDSIELKMQISRRQLETRVWHSEARGRWIQFWVSLTVVTQLNKIFQGEYREWKEGWKSHWNNSEPKLNTPLSIKKLSEDSCVTDSRRRRRKKKSLGNSGYSPNFTQVFSPLKYIFHGSGTPSCELGWKWFLTGITPRIWQEPTHILSRLRNHHPR